MNIENDLLIDLLQAVNKALVEQMKEVLEKHQILPTSMMIASKINKNPGISISELSRVTKIAKSHISNIIEQLDQRGWIEKRFDPQDQRIVQIFLTEDAVKYYQIVRADIREYMSGVVSQIPQERTEGLIKGLQDLKTVLDQV